MTSAAPSTRPARFSFLSGPVDVCVAVPRLALDRPFTYLLGDDSAAGVGSLVSVPFHGRSVRGWVLGPAASVPEGRVLPVRKVLSPVRFFHAPLLDLFRWMSLRYLAPLATVIERSHPPRVAGEEPRSPWPPAPPDVAPLGHPPVWAPGVLADYGGADSLLAPETTTWLRPLPSQEVDVCVAAVEACLSAGKRAIVVVPEAQAAPATAAAVLEAFVTRAAAFIGGDPRERYRTWLDIAGGAFDVVVATRPGVFAPLPSLGLVWVSREVHPGHREDRSPYYHTREVATARAKLEGASCVVAALSPSVETATLVGNGQVRTWRAPRHRERAEAPLVETVAPEAEDRSVRLTTLLRRARSAALIVSRRGYGVARVCRVCSAPAACAECSGPIVVRGGAPVCRVCGLPGRCRNCGGGAFGVERGGSERIAEWAKRTGSVPVVLHQDGEAAPPGRDRIVVGTAAAVNDVGPRHLDLVAILDPDRALLRAGLHSGEQSVATWMEAAAWAGPRSEGGRVLVHTRRPGHPAIQALVRWEPLPFLQAEAARRTEAGFPPGHATFRITGNRDVEDALGRTSASVVVSAAAEGRTICLVTVAPADLPGFRRDVLGLAATGVVSRVEAEPQL
jgi:primosomal protein N' (replication factor Y) (superfamily II helicase)